MIRAAGCSRRARRIAWRAWRSASAVTAQVLTITASLSPASPAARRMASLSKALSRQPKVTISDAAISASDQDRVEAALETERCRSAHQHKTMAGPGDVEAAAVE